MHSHLPIRSAIGTSSALGRHNSASLRLAAALIATLPFILGPGLSTAARVPEALPGARPFDASLRARLAAELESRGKTYTPRTRRLNEDGSPVYTNRLLLEHSPYLQQHAHNPVDWRPWGDEAFAEARRLNRPVFVSIGYSTCHWCHVMEEESFDDPAIATLLNEGFIAIKVDRETRPDIDAVYMAAVQALTGSGGWPLNVFMTPDREPFFGGTYFPPTDRGGRPGLPTVLASIGDHWRDRHDEIIDMAGELSEAIRTELEGLTPQQSQAVGTSPLVNALRQIEVQADPDWGGIGRRTKFPSSLPVRLLLRIHRRSGDARALEMAELALEKMAAGGLQDQVGGGFHRYSTDRRWLVPHFEKMLYDNALLAVVYLEGWQATGREEFAHVARRTLDYLANEMTAPDGGLYSSTDADSLAPNGEMEEGRFFTWTPDEIEEAVGADRARVLRAAYGVTESGNFEGRNILHAWTTPDLAAASLGLTQPAYTSALEDARAALYEARARRPHPLRDEKILSAWNGLAISAFARAGFAFDAASHLEHAKRAAEALLSSRDAEGRLPRARLHGHRERRAFLEDYAFTIAGLIDLYEASGEPRWLREAVALQGVLDRFHADETGGGYFRTASDSEVLLVREKPTDDGAIPSGNSVEAMNLLRLYELTLQDRYRRAGSVLFSAFAPILERQPTSVSELLLALDARLDGLFEIAIVGDDSERAPLLAPLRRSFVPNRVLSVSGTHIAEEHIRLVPLLEGKRAIGGRATAYVCRNRICRYPTADPAKLVDELAVSTPLALRPPPTGR